MKNQTSVQFKVQFIIMQAIFCGGTNCVANGLCYYIFSHGVEKDIMGFILNATITAFILSIICALLGVSPTNNAIKKHKIPEGSFSRKSSLLLNLYPKDNQKIGAQVFITAILITIFYLFFSAGVITLLSYVLGFAGGTIPVKLGALIHGILAGSMGAMNMYFIAAVRFANHEAAVQKRKSKRRFK